jgi:BirA family biotin operon repressor/biotin-[acetyl-CoA-carboxylase] ligase
MPAELDVGCVEQGIAGTRFAGLVRHRASVESTNELAIRAAQAGEVCGVWTAEEQTAGRGRGGHAWHSAPGDGIYVSALVTLPVSIHRAVELPLAAGLATQAAVRETTGLGLDLRWPNDLMFGDQKCGGILVESASDGEQMRYAVVGIGLNVNHAAFPVELRAVATSLHLESGREFAREPIVAAMLRWLDVEIGWIEQVGVAGGSGIFARFAAASSWVQGKRVRVGEGEGSYTGLTRGMDAQGFLLVEDGAGSLRTVLSGGVRSAGPQASR